MFIRKLYVENYKSIKKETFFFNKGINVLVGKNNAGKSNIVSALNELLSDKFNSSSYEDKIFYFDNSSQIQKNFKIVAKIEDIHNLDYSLLDNLKKSTALLDITEVFDENDENFNNEWLIKDDDELKEKYPTEFEYRRSKLIYKNTTDLKKIFSNTKIIWIYKYYNKDDDTNIFSIILKEEIQNDLFDENNKQIKYYRTTYMNSNIKATLITSLLVPAFRSTDTTLKITKWTWYGKLLQKIWNDTCTEDSQIAIEQSSDNLKKTIGKVYSKLKNDVNDQLKKTLTLMNITLDINMLENKSEDYYKNIRLSVDDGVETALESKGSGLQSLIMIELFKFYCKEFNQTSLLILEEPELFLHPHAKRMLSDILNDFIDNNKNQIIITTHSEEFIKNVDIENINVIRKNFDGTKKYRISKTNFKDEKELQKLKIELQYKNAEMFFAEKVILVEGEEKILIPEIIKKIYGKDMLNNNDISIIKVGGKSYFSIYRKVLNELNIKNYIIADYDIINNGLNNLLNDDAQQKLTEIRSKISDNLKSNNKINKEMGSRDWASLVNILDGMTVNMRYDIKLNEVWNSFRSRIFTKTKLKDLNEELQKDIINFIEDLYDSRIFIMKEGELEDYYKKENFDSELSKINSKGITAYKIAELSIDSEIDKYLKIDEYKEILSKIIDAND